MSGFLEDVLASTAERIAAGRRERSESELRRVAAALPPARSLVAALAAPGRRFIAEVKRASPSRGDLAEIADPAALAGAYERGGAAAISVLTEPSRFKGSLEDLHSVRKAVTIPVLRKDFLVEPWQAWETRASGADAALLIAAALPGARLTEMAGAIAEAGLEALVEVHDERELETVLAAGAPVVGVNARDLRSLEVDLAVVERLGPRIPRGVTGVAESGIRAKADVARLEAAGFRRFLVGEALAAAGDPEATLRDWTA